MRPLSACRLYGILDLGYVTPEAAEGMARRLVDGGVDLLQLRAKKLAAGDVEALARRLVPVTREAGVPLVINDHPAAAAAAGCEGVHVGQDDLGVAEARRVIGASCLVGKSTHSVAQARAAIAEGADYIGFGPLFATGTKPDYAPIGLADIAGVEQFSTVPVFAIGGINLARLPQVLGAGARRVVMVSAFLQAEDVSWTVRRAKEMLRENDG